MILPSTVQDRRNKKSYQIRKNHEVEEGFGDFINFMKVEIMLVNDYNFSKNALFELKKIVKIMLTSLNGTKHCFTDNGKEFDA